jgi:RNA polymerase sigma factor (sigma-70 family)
MTISQADDTRAPDVAQLVLRAADGDRRAWERLVDQYARLIWAITRDFKLSESDAADVAQVTWLRLLENIRKIEHPDRVGAWIAATARNECLRCLASKKRVVLADDLMFEGAATNAPEIDERLLMAERSEMVREALARLPVRWQRMLELLMADPPASYAEISDQLGLPVGSIGPTRSRCLGRLRVIMHKPLDGDVHQRPGSRRDQARVGTELRRSATTQWPPVASTPGNAARTSGRRSARNRTTETAR